MAEVACRILVSPERIVGYRGADDSFSASLWVDHPFLPWVGRPSHEYTMTVEEDGRSLPVRVANNAFGFRSHDIPTEKLPGDYFIVCLGGSTTWGAHAESNADTWPELLEARLRARYPSRNVRVFNFGTSQATVVYSLVAFALIGINVQPDLVIVYHGFNDYGPVSDSRYRIDQAHIFHDLALDGRWHGLQASVPRSWLRSYVITLATGLVDRWAEIGNLSAYVAGEIDYDPAMNVAATAVARLRRNWSHLETIEAIARGRGARSLFSTFQFTRGDERPNAVVNRSLLELFRERGFDYVDQDALIPDNDPTLQFDQCHFTRAGRERMAENFFAHIAERGWIAP